MILEAEEMATAQELRVDIEAHEQVHQEPLDSWRGRGWFLMGVESDGRFLGGIRALKNRDKWTSRVRAFQAALTDCGWRLLRQKPSDRRALPSFTQV